MLDRGRNSSRKRSTGMGPMVWPNVCIATLRRVVGGDELEVDAERDGSEVVDMLPNCAAGTER